MKSRPAGWKSNDDLAHRGSSGSSTSHSEEITYLVANYNCAAYVAECLQSLHRQDLERWRCVICDDCSTDGSVNVIEQCLTLYRSGDRVSFLKNEENIGYIETLKRMLTAATTDIVGILDADDFLEPRATRLILVKYAEGTSVRFVHSRCRTVDVSSSPIPTNSPLCARVPPGRTALVHGYIGHLRTFRRTAYSETAGLDSSLLYAEDRDLAYKLEEVAQPHFIDEVLYNYRLVRGSQSTDERKYQKGVRNHVVARRNAMERRGIKGLDLFVHGLLNSCLLGRAGEYGAFRSLASRYLLKAMIRLIAVSDHSSGRLWPSPTGQEIRR